jgi:hypothetical protein
LSGKRALKRGYTGLVFVSCPWYAAAINADPRWSATDPNPIYYADETRLMAYNSATQQMAVVHELASDFPGQNLAAVSHDTTRM